MTLFNCCRKFSCTAAAVIASIIIGVVTAFLHITGVVTATPAFLWAVLGVAVVFLGGLVIAGALKRKTEQSCCLCSSLSALLAGILGTVLFSVVLLAIGVIATSVLSAILVGVLLFFFSLIITSTACLVKCLFACND